MDNKPRPTIFQRLTNVFGGTSSKMSINNIPQDNDGIILRTRDKEEFEEKSLELKQQKLLSRQWRKAEYDVSNRSLIGLNEVKMMYRDADLMDTFPEIGAALDIIAEEATFIKNEGYMINVTSKSERIRSIIQDLLVNRLAINTTLPMVCRAMCKYGNNFMLLNIDKQNGVIGWKQLPVYEIERYENGVDSPYAAAFKQLSSNDLDKTNPTKFVWVGENEYIPYMNWQIGHFRLLYDSLFLPYGVSYLHKARRHFRMLSMMEDMMLIYRLERSIERRVFKINVGAIDEADVPAYVQQIADNFKRTPIVDPLTGQLDLRKNLLNVSEDFFIPVRDDSAPNPIDTLQGAQNMTAIDDIKFIQNKVMTALRIPKTFLNFEESQGDGKNLSLLDVRFMRTVNRIQQSLLMELNKICIIHLYLLGFTDDLTNFTLSMNSPSSQAEMLELENMAKKITTAKDAVTDGGNGMPLMSVTRALKQILGWSEKDIKENLEELRLEKALVYELENTPQIIKRTKIFDPVDNIYGEPGAEYAENAGGQGDDGGMGGGPGGGGGSIGGALDFGNDSDMGGEVPEMGAEGDMGGMPEMGAEGDMSMGAAANEENALAGMTPNENIRRSLKNLITENNKRVTSELIIDKLTRAKDSKSDIVNAFAPLSNKNFIVNEELNNISKQLKLLSK